VTAGWRALIRPDGGSPAFAALPAAAALLGLLALAAPLGDAQHPLFRVGALLALAGLIELLHAVRRAEPAATRRGLTSGALTLLMALLLVNAPYLAGAAIILLLAAAFGIDALGSAMAAWRATTARTRLLSGLAAIGNLLVLGLLLTRRDSATWVVTIVAAARMLGVAWTMAVTPVHTARDATRTAFDELDLGDHPDAHALRDEVAAEEAAVRGPGARRMILSYLFILFAIHIARMQVDGSLVGYVAPAVALVGDMVLAALIVLGVVLPVTVASRRATRGIERRVWRW
jgi:uncharacterized membrane protein HdeD (DUF308 family)